MKYTPSQQEAVGCTDRNLQIIACAGSGKTQVIAARAVELLRQGGSFPANIVAFTFTDKAAAELKDRIRSLAATDLGDVQGLAEMYVGTIHGFCLELLQNYLFEFLKYNVLNEMQTRLLVSRNSKKSGLAEVEIIAGPSARQRLNRRPRDVTIFLEALNIIREDDVKWESLPRRLQEALDKYTDLLDGHAYLDYSRIMIDAVAGLYDSQNPIKVHLQRQLAERIKHLIVDEYQDVNPIQEQLIRQLHEFGASVCVVGDDDQTIYQWRGSDIRNIIDFAKRYPSVYNVTLAENFRSSPGIVEAARLIAERNNPERLSKAMSAGGHQSFERGDLLALTFESPVSEARWIARKIIELRGTPVCDIPDSEPRGLSWSDCAVLLRSVRRSGEPIVAALREAEIPFVIGGLANLFDFPEVEASVTLFEYITGAAGEDDILRAWQRADLGLSESDLRSGIVVLNRARSWQPGERWGAYNIQRAFLDFLEAVNLREERVPPTSTGAARGEVIYYNLGKFSQVISDFEQIYFQSEPQEKYRSFVWWIRNEAPEHYEEGGDDVGFAQPDAVQVMTVHQAKGMEWPAVFIPALQRNRFPSTAGRGGRTKWHILPKDAVQEAARYDGSVPDERRLFYVGLTRSKKYLYCSFAPTPGNNRYSQQSRFFREFTEAPQVLTHDPKRPIGDKLDPRPKRETPNVILNFSELKYFFECPYQFKLRFLYGFNAPLHEALGYGKSVHNTLAEIHKRALAGDLVDESQAEDLVDSHLHTPFAYPVLREQLRLAAISDVRRYLRQYGSTLAQTIHSEQQVEISVTPGITVNGRIDLIKRVDTEEVAIVDFKSSERAQPEEVTRTQLHTYAMGYRQLTGTNADLLEVLNLDEGGQNVREIVDTHMLAETEHEIRRAGSAIRENDFERLTNWCKTCVDCDLMGICRSRQ